METWEEESRELIKSRDGIANDEENDGGDHRVEDVADRVEKFERVEIRKNGIYPVRPTKKDCPRYVLTGTCKFRRKCRYNHPERLGKPLCKYYMETGTRKYYMETGTCIYPVRMTKDCSYYVLTGFCKFGRKCRYNHPLEKPLCKYYMVTGTCMFNSSCKYHHPKTRVPLRPDSEKKKETCEEENRDLIESRDGIANDEENDGGDHRVGVEDKADLSPWFFKIQLNDAKDIYPLRPDTEDCSFYVETGTCKFGHKCRYNHPAKTDFQIEDTKRGIEDSGGSVADAGNIDCKQRQMKTRVPTPSQCALGEKVDYSQAWDDGLGR